MILDEKTEGWIFRFTKKYSHELTDLELLEHKHRITNDASETGNLNNSQFRCAVNAIETEQNERAKYGSKRWLMDFCCDGNRTFFAQIIRKLFAAFYACLIIWGTLVMATNCNEQAITIRYIVFFVTMSAFGLSIGIIGTMLYKKRFIYATWTTFTLILFMFGPAITFLTMIPA